MKILGQGQNLGKKQDFWGFLDDAEGRIHVENDQKMPFFRGPLFFRFLRSALEIFCKISKKWLLY
jgi:hypothetical protein